MNRSGLPHSGAPGLSLARQLPRAFRRHATPVIGSARLGIHREPIPLALRYPPPSRTFLMLAEGGHSALSQWDSPYARARLENTNGSTCCFPLLLCFLIPLLRCHWAPTSPVAFAAAGWASIKRWSPERTPVLPGQQLSIIFLGAVRK